MFGIKMTQTGKKYFTAVIVIFLVYLAMKYVSPIASPFLLALLLSGLLNPLASALHKKIKIKKSVLAGIILFLISIIFIVAVWLLLSALFTGGGKLACQIPDYQEELSMLLCNCCEMIERQFGVDGMQIEQFVLEQVNILAENLEVNILPAVMGKSMDYAKNIAGFVSFLVVMIIAALLIIKDYDRLMERLNEEKDFKAVREVGIKIIFYIKVHHSLYYQYPVRCCVNAERLKGRYYLRTGHRAYGYAPFYRYGHHAHPASSLSIDKRKLSPGPSLFCPLCRMRPGPGISGAKADRRPRRRLARGDLICRFCGASFVWNLGDY